MTLVLVSGGLDLSVGSVLAVGSVICGITLNAGVPVPIAIINRKADSMEGERITNFYGWSFK